MGHNQLCEAPQQQAGSRRKRVRRRGCGSPWINPACRLGRLVFFPLSPLDKNASQPAQEVCDLALLWFNCVRQTVLLVTLALSHRHATLLVVKFQ